MKLLPILNEILKDISERPAYGDIPVIRIPDKNTISDIYLNSELKEIGPIKDYSKYISNLFPQSRIKQIVYRQGLINDGDKAGGIWFGDTEQDVISFSKSVFNKIQPSSYIIHKCRINLTNPKFYDRFWDGYLEESSDHGGKDGLKYFLINQGYDGIFIRGDTWNDTGDEHSVHSKQFVIFNPNNIHSLGSEKDIEGFKNYMSNNKSNITTHPEEKQGIFPTLISKIEKGEITSREAYYDVQNNPDYPNNLKKTILNKLLKTYNTTK